MDDGPKIYNLRLGTVHQRDQLTPVFQYWTQSALPWLGDLDTIPKTEKQ